MWDQGGGGPSLSRMNKKTTTARKSESTGIKRAGRVEQRGGGRKSGDIRGKKGNIFLEGVEGECVDNLRHRLERVRGNIKRGGRN